ncbi:hypothetical protein ACLOJK_017258 [Asimina triloba]
MLIKTDANRQLNVEVAANAQIFLQAHAGLEPCQGLLKQWESLKPSTKLILALAAEAESLQKDKEHLRINLHRAEEEVKVLFEANNLLDKENKRLLRPKHREKHHQGSESKYSSSSSAKALQEMPEFCVGAFPFPELHLVFADDGGGCCFSNAGQARECIIADRDVKITKLLFHGKNNHCLKFVVWFVLRKPDCPDKKCSLESTNVKGKRKSSPKTTDIGKAIDFNGPDSPRQPLSPLQTNSPDSKMHKKT